MHQRKTTATLDNKTVHDCIIQCLGKMHGHNTNAQITLNIAQTSILHQCYKVFYTSTVQTVA